MSVSARRCVMRNGCRRRAGEGAMSRQPSRQLLLAAGPLLALGLAACSGTADDLLDPILPEQDAAYKSSKTAPPLEVPWSRSTKFSVKMLFVIVTEPTP